MRNILLLVGAAAISVGSAGAAQAQCASPLCEPPPMVLGDALTHGVPLIWSTAAGRLVPAMRYGRPIVIGRTVPDDEILGRRVQRFGPAAREVDYNSPDRLPGLVEPGLSLLPVGYRHSALRRLD